MGLLELCEKYFNTKNLYDVLEVTKKATEKEVKKAYHKLSLKVHPDRVNEEDKLEATEKFKVLGSIHSILSDTNKRAVYDETGKCDDEDIDDTNKDWTVYWRMFCKKITEEDIRNYEKEFIGSQEERDELKKAYLSFKGDMDQIVNHVQFARSDQEPRMKGILNEMIESGEIPAYKIFTHEPLKKTKRRHAKERREAKEHEEWMEERSQNGQKDLAVMIQEKQEDRAKAFDSLIDGLAAKYGGASAKKATKRKATTKTEGVKKRKTRK